MNFTVQNVEIGIIVYLSISCYPSWNFRLNETNEEIGILRGGNFCWLILFSFSCLVKQTLVPMKISFFGKIKKDRRMKTEGGNRSRVQKQQLEILITTFHPGKDIRVDMTPTK